MTITNDPTEEVRRNRLAELSGAVESQNPTTERQRLEARHGQVWDTPELSNDFEVIGFMAHFSAETRERRRRGKNHRPVISRKQGPTVKLAVNEGKPKRDRKR